VFGHHESVRSRTSVAWGKQVCCADLACAMLKTLKTAGVEGWAEWGALSRHTSAKLGPRDTVLSLTGPLLLVLDHPYPLLDCS